MSRLFKWLLLLSCWVTSALSAADLPESPDPGLEAALQDALERGDFVQLAALGQPYYDAKEIPAELTPLSCLLLGMGAMDQPGSAIPFFRRALPDPVVGIRARCWLADAYLSRGLPLVAQNIADELRKIAPGSPAISYVEGRIA